MNRFLSFFERIFSLDLRALALLRIGVGFLILLDLGIRLTDLEVFYTNDGVLPLHLLFLHNWEPGFFSFHTMSGSFTFQLTLFLLAAAAAFSYLLGFKTKLTGVVSFLLLVSLHNRNSLITQGGDDFLRMTLFWMLFLPTARYYSIDRIWKKQVRPPESSRVFNLASVGYVLQIGMVYSFSALLKSSPEWGTEGTALYYALSLDQLVLPLGKTLLGYPELLTILTFIVLYLELYAPLLLLVPWKNDWARMIFIVLIVGLHLGIASTLFVGLFPLIGIGVMLGLVPSGWARWLGQPFDWAEQKMAGRIMHLRRQVRAVVQVGPLLVKDQRIRRPVRIVRDTFLVSCIAYCLVWNVKHVFPEQLNAVNQLAGWGNFLRINQHWGMFSPAVFKDDGWFVAKGALANGDTVNVFSGDPVDFNKPEYAVDFYKNDRWRKYYEHYIFIARMYMRPVHCNYLIKSWNADHSQEEMLTEVQVFFVKEISAPNFAHVAGPPEMVCQCTL